MENIDMFFKDHIDKFVIYVVEQKFVVGRGSERFKNWLKNNNYISSEEKAQNLIKKCIKEFGKIIPVVISAVLIILQTKNHVPSESIDLSTLITTLVKSFNIEHHQAASTEIIDPIILQEDKITKKSISKIVSLYRESIYRPAIIIVLKDNDFERAKDLLSKCPNGTTVKFIRNSGETALYLISNAGEDNIDDFFESYIYQCFSTCSSTPREVLLPKSISKTSIVQELSPLTFKIRSSLLIDNKGEVRNDIKNTIDELNKMLITSPDDKFLLFYKFVFLMFKIYCDDYAGNDLNVALDIAHTLNNDVLRALVYRYANFTKLDYTVKNNLMLEGEKIFISNEMIDQAIYCKNNYLLNQFYTPTVNEKAFNKMCINAKNSAPGLVGLSHIYNNCGVANLYKGNPEYALEMFQTGLLYAKERPVQKFGIKCNNLIARNYINENIDESEIITLVKEIIDAMGVDELSFLTANYIANILIICCKQRNGLEKLLLETYPIDKIFENALSPNKFGSKSLKTEICLLKEFGIEFNFTNSISAAKSNDNIRENYLLREKLNPAIYNAWL